MTVTIVSTSGEETGIANSQWYEVLLPALQEIGLFEDPSSPQTREMVLNAEWSKFKPSYECGGDDMSELVMRMQDTVSFLTWLMNEACFGNSVRYQ